MCMDSSSRESLAGRAGSLMAEFVERRSPGKDSARLDAPLHLIACGIDWGFDKVTILRGEDGTVTPLFDSWPLTKFSSDQLLEIISCFEKLF